MTGTSATVDAGAPSSVWVPLAEAAKHQKVSRQAVSKRVGQLVAAGRLTVRDGPRGTKLVNLVAYMRAVREETDPAQHLRNGTDPELFPGDTRDDDEAGASSGQRSPGYHDARAQREAFNAENARLDLEERRGRLMVAEDAANNTMTAFRRVRDRFLALPATLADRLIAQPDAAAVRVMLDKEIRAALEAAANDLDRMGEDDPDEQ